MPLQEAPPDTSTYMIAGYVVFVLIMAVYLVSLFVRRRNLEQDLSTLERLRAESKAPAGAASPSARPATAIARRLRAKAAARKKVAKKVPRKR